MDSNLNEIQEGFLGEHNTTFRQRHTTWCKLRDQDPAIAGKWGTLQKVGCFKTYLLWVQVCEESTFT